MVLRKIKILITYKIFQSNNKAQDHHTRGLIYTNIGVSLKHRTHFKIITSNYPSVYFVIIQDVIVLFTAFLFLTSES